MDATRKSFSFQCFVSKAKVALCSDATVHCHRADLLIDILCGWAVGRARRVAAPPTDSGGNLWG